jgi:hypothetical protein
MDCGKTCEDAKKMWKEAEETQQLAIDLQKNNTADRISAETDLLVEDVKLKVQTQGQRDVQLLEGNVVNYLQGRVQQFSGAIANRHGQVLAKKAAQFETLKGHQGQLLEHLMNGVMDHGYAVAKSTVAQEAAAAGVNFNSNVKIHTALQSVSKAANAWANTYHASDLAAQQGFGAWSSAHHSLDASWSNITDTFELSNRASMAARGLGPDTRWMNQVVRISGDVVQAANTEVAEEAANADLAAGMAKKASDTVQGNSGNIAILKQMLADAETQTNAAAMAR